MTYDLCVDVLHTLRAINSQTRLDTLADDHLSHTVLTQYFLDTLIKTDQLLSGSLCSCQTDSSMLDWWKRFDTTLLDVTQHISCLQLSARRFTSMCRWGETCTELLTEASWDSSPLFWTFNDTTESLLSHWLDMEVLSTNRATDECRSLLGFSEAPSLHLIKWSPWTYPSRCPNSTLIQDSMSELSMYKDDVQTKLAPYAQEAGEHLAADLQKLANKLRDHMMEGREQMDKYSQELQTMMEQNADDVRTRVSAYTRKLKKRLNKDTQEIKRWVNRSREASLQAGGKLCPVRDSFFNFSTDFVATLNCFTEIYWLSWGTLVRKMSFHCCSTSINVVLMFIVGDWYTAYCQKAELIMSGLPWWGKQ